MEELHTEALYRSQKANPVSATLSKHWHMLKKNAVLSFVVGALCVFVLFNFNKEGHLVHGIGYLAAMWVCAFIVDVCMMIFPTKAPEILVKEPKKESFFFILFTFLGVAFLVIRFMVIKDWAHVDQLVKLSLIPLLLFIFPIAIGVYLLIKNYSVKQLGLRFDKSLLVSLPVAAVTGLTTWLVAPENIHWKEMLQSEGILAFLWEGFILAALSEEFWRFVGQTRLGILLKNAPWALFITVTFWALMHTPKWYSDGNGDLYGALCGSARIIPLGLMWSYMIHRTRSIMPSILVHATNLWGLQNG